jgi:CelD/BcsL family acetyltransferase involved in cellulose biosynthesis
MFRDSSYPLMEWANSTRRLTSTPQVVTMPAMLTLEILTYSDWAGVSPEWTELEREASNATFFVSEKWVGAWLSVFGEQLRPEILLFRAGTTLVGACLLVTRWRWRGPVPVRRLVLNTAGEDDADSPWVEFNTLLCRDGWENSVASTVAAHILKREWDELVLPGMCDVPASAYLLSALGGRAVRRSDKPSYYLDLAELRATGKPYEETLSRKVRQQVRQSVRKYEETGPLAVACASSEDEALIWLTHLAELHEQTWSSRGLPGSFGSARFVAFHRQLISASYQSGAIQLLWIRAGSQDVGLLYNFVYRRKVYFYQCGFSYGTDKRLKPGFVAQVMAVRFAADRQLDEYDMMAGAQPYKKELAERYRNLSWLEYSGNTWRSRVVCRLRAAKRRLVGASPRSESQTDVPESE